MKITKEMLASIRRRISARRSVGEHSSADELQALLAERKALREALRHERPHGMRTTRQIERMDAALALGEDEE